MDAHGKFEMYQRSERVAVGYSLEKLSLHVLESVVSTSSVHPYLEVFLARRKDHFYE